MFDALAPQDGLHTLVEREDRSDTGTVVGWICKVLFAAEPSQETLQVNSDPAIRIVSLTVAENGYCLNPAEQLDLAHQAVLLPWPDVQARRADHR